MARKKSDIVDRQAKAVGLRSAGHTYSTIASKLGYAGASGAYKAVSKALAATLREGCDELRSLESERLDALQAAVWRSALAGHLGAVASVLKIMERRAKSVSWPSSWGSTPTK